MLSTINCPTFLIIALWALTATASKAATTASDIQREYERAARFGSSEMGGLVDHSSVNANWIEGTDSFWFQRSDGKMIQYVLIDAANGKRTIFSDPGKLPKSKKKQQAIEQPSSISIQPEWHVPKSSVENKDNNLWLRDSDGKENQLTTDGSQKKTYGKPEPSPSGNYFVCWKTYQGDNALMYSIESSPAGSLRPVLKSYVYALPGDKVDTHELWIIDSNTKRIFKAKTDIVDWEGAPQIRWNRQGDKFTYGCTSRGYRRERIVEVDIATGESRAIVDEKSNTFIYPPARELRYLDSSNEILRTSEQDGWNHLYLLNKSTGEVKTQITKGPWVVRRLVSLDEINRTLIFTASGKDPDEDPYLVKYYRVNFNGSGLICLTPGNREHNVSWSPDQRYLLDTYSRVDQEPVTELRRADDGRLICEVERADITRLTASGWKKPKPFCAKGRDGNTDIWGVIYFPTKMKFAAKYPIIEDIYAGPQGSFVPKTFSAQRAQQGLAELGFIVVQIDGMGTANRSKAFHDVADKNLADSGFPDRIAWMQAAAKKYPAMDLTRVGIYGTSAGGYNAARALIDHNDFYSVAVSVSANHDHRTDKVWWNELWMGYPVGPHYIVQSNVTQAAKLKGKLLLMHGELDDNVNASASTMQFVNALIKANKDFDMLLVPGGGHGYGPYGQRRMWDYFVRNLQHREPPANFDLSAFAEGRIDIVIRNRSKQMASIFWVKGDGAYQKYHDLAAGQEIKQSTFTGHRWAASVNGKETFYTVNRDLPEWNIDL